MKIRAIDKIITKVSGKFGAQCGRRDVGTRPTFGAICNQKVRLTKDGYDSGGVYWGTPDNLRVEYTTDLSYIRFYRDNETEQKKTEIKNNPDLTLEQATAIAKIIWKGASDYFIQNFAKILQKNGYGWLTKKHINTNDAEEIASILMNETKESILK